MAGGYEVQGPGDLAPLFEALAALRAEVKEIGRPDGPQIAQALATLTALVDGILTQANGIFSGFVTAGTTISSVGRGTFDGGVTSADVKSRTLSVGYDSVYIDANNIMGKAPSARRFKQDIAVHNFDPSVVDQMQGHTFRIIAAVEQLGDDAPVEVGYIADELAELGLETFVRYDPDGQISGLAYERIVIVAIDALKDARREIAEIKTHLGL